MADLGLISNQAFVFMAMLLIASISGYLSEKVGIINIGIDGMMCFGAIFFAIFSSEALKMEQHGFGMIIFALILTMIATSITGLIHGYACIKWKANQIISGTAINLVGVAFATFLNEPLGKIINEGANRLRSGFDDFYFLGNSIYLSSVFILIFALLIALTVFVVMHYTKTGLRYCAIGENPSAVFVQGVNVIKYQWIALILSSMMAGLAGALFLYNIKQFQGNTQGFGFLALAILIAGAWKIEWMATVSFCFSYFIALSYSTLLTNFGIHKEASFAIPYIFNFLVLLFFSKKIRPPKNSGIPFDPNNAK